MSQPASSSRPHLSVSSAYELRRAIIDRAFRAVGFLATFFGLAMLVLFLGGLLQDVASWFRVMPGLVQEGNVRLEARAQGKDKKLQELKAKLLQDMEASIARKETEAQKQAVRQLYESRLIPSALEDQRQTMAENEQMALQPRTDTSAWSLFAYFIGAGSGSEAHDTGIRPALLGSIFLGIITVVFAVPLGVGAALYLEEYAPHSKRARKLAKIIQVNISNLAGVPSVVFGILGAYIFVDLIFRPMEDTTVPLPFPFGGAVAARNVIGGGLTLALLTLPVIIVSAQEAIRAVPMSIRHGAYALGATKWQATWNLVLPCSFPGIMTGTILAMARAMGEAAPLVLFGAIIFTNQDPNLFSRFTVLPMQIFAWCDEVDEAWRYNAALASLVLLVTLMSLNGVAIWLRQKYQAKLRW